MMSDFHFLRPAGFLFLLPFLALLGRLWWQNPRLLAWSAICDAHLLTHLIQKKGVSKRNFALFCLLMAGILMSFGLAGPSWSRLPVPTFHAIQPRVLLLDLSQGMLNDDLTPNRLTRAKFKLHDLFLRRDAGQLGLVVYTAEPFVVSPLTDDANTIDALLQTLTPDIMPVPGQRLDNALDQAATLINDAGFNQGQLLVLTGDIPDNAATNKAAALARRGIVTSILPVVADKSKLPFFQPLATAGKGLLLPFQDTANDIEQWLTNTNQLQWLQSTQNEIPLWRDEGRWFVLAALFFLWPVFWRGWLQRIDS